MQNRKTLLCYGDSNTFGYMPGSGGKRYLKEKTWPYILAEKLGDGYELIVEGLSGRTTAYDRPDGAWKNGYTYLTPCLASHMPLDHVVFMLGTNDCNFDLCLSPEDIAHGMEKLIVTTCELCLERQGYVPEMTVVVPAAIRPEIAGTPFEDQIDASSVRKSHEIAPLYRALAEKHGCRFLDASEGPEVSDIDCEHLTENGHRLLAELLYPVICGKGK